MDLAELDRSIEQRGRTLWRVVWRDKFVFVLVAAVVFCALVAFMLSLQPMYEGSTILIGGQGGIAQAADGAAKPVETPVALTRIAESDEVVSSAIERVGLQNLVSGPSSAARPSRFAELRRLAFPSRAESERTPSPVEAALPAIKAAISVRSETNSDVIRIAFRHRDPAVAARFANALAQAFVDRQIVLYSRPGAADFFLRQQQRFEAEAKATADELENFSAKTAVYSADDQKQLLLKRLNDLKAALAVTRGQISQKAGERQTLAEELRKLAPVTRSPFVSSLVDQLGGGRSGAPAADARSMDERSADPPLLLVKVYQDSMVDLFKINSDLVGAQSLERAQTEEVANLTAELNVLAENEQQFDRLKRAIDRATYNADVYSKRMVEEQINAESSAARFSSVKVMQRATVPLRPVSPNYIVFTLAAAAASAMAGLGAALLRSRAR
jgi:uncharacterized protein involved in exopolysaccharide biosynthesis